MTRQGGEKRSSREKQKGKVEMAPEFQELGSKRQDKWPEAIKLMQTVLPIVRDRKVKDGHSTVPVKAQKLCPGKKKKNSNTRRQVVFYS